MKHIFTALIFVLVASGLYAQGASAKSFKSINYNMNQCGSPATIQTYVSEVYDDITTTLSATNLTGLTGYSTVTAAVSNASTTDLTSLASYVSSHQIDVCIRRQWAVQIFGNNSIVLIDKIQSGKEGVYIDPKYLP